MTEGRSLFVLGCAPDGRARSLGRFLGAAFVGFGLLLLLAGVQQNLPPALAGGGACIFAGLTLLAVVHRGKAPVLILDGAHGAAALCRRRLGSRAFRLFPLTVLEITAAPEGGAVRIRPAEAGGSGREIPGLPSRISDRDWRQGMTLPTPGDGAPAAVAELERWQSLVRRGEAPEFADACDAAEFAALLGKALPELLLQELSDGGAPLLPPRAAQESPREMPGRAAWPAPHPEIRRAPDLRNATGNRDKRD